VNIINGIKLANEILAQSAQKIITYKVKPVLTIIMVGDNEASLTYVNKKKLAGESIGVQVNVLHYEKSTNEEIISLIQELNSDKNVFGIILQLPSPGIDDQIVCEYIDPAKDVDGLNPLNLGRLWLNRQDVIMPATAKAAIHTLIHIAQQLNIPYAEFITGKNVLIINRSTIIGKPLAAILTNANATVTLAHSKTTDLDSLFANADIII
jgi:methylenetetrahydrofolate dehydrogenase (NADP+) / methenyltetrahydrofolate cyclohydrolase